MPITAGTDLTPTLTLIVRQKLGVEIARALSV